MRQKYTTSPSRGKILKEDILKLFPKLKEWNSPDMMSRWEVAKILGGIDEDYIYDVLSIFKELAKDKEHGVHWMASESLRKICTTKGVELLSILKEWVNDENSGVRRIAIRSFGIIGIERFDEVLPLLKESARDESWYVRWGVARSFAELWEKSPEEILPFFEYLAKDDNEYVRRSVAAAPGDNISKRNKKFAGILKSLPILENLIRDNERDVRIHAVYSLTEIVKWKFYELLPLLEIWAKDKDEYIRDAVKESLGNALREKSQEILPTLKIWAEKDNEKIRELVASVLNIVSKEELPEVLPILKDLIEDKNESVRIAATKSFTIIVNGKFNEVFPTLQIWAKEKSMYILQAIWASLAEINKENLIKSLPIFKTLVLNSPPRGVWDKFINSNPKNFLVILNILAGDTNERIREAVVSSIGEISESLLLFQIEPILKNLRNDEYPDVRIAASKSWSRIFPSD